MFDEVPYFLIWAKNERERTSERKGRVELRSKGPNVEQANSRTNARNKMHACIQLRLLKLPSSYKMV